MPVVDKLCPCSAAKRFHPRGIMDVSRCTRTVYPVASWVEARNVIPGVSSICTAVRTSAPERVRCVTGPIGIPALAESWRPNELHTMRSPDT